MIALRRAEMRPVELKAILRGSNGTSARALSRFCTGIIEPAAAAAAASTGSRRGNFFTFSECLQYIHLLLPSAACVLSKLGRKTSV